MLIQDDVYEISSLRSWRYSIWKSIVTWSRKDFERHLGVGNSHCYLQKKGHESNMIAVGTGWPSVYRSFWKILSSIWKKNTGTEIPKLAVGFGWFWHLIDFDCFRPVLDFDWFWLLSLLFIVFLCFPLILIEFDWSRLMWIDCDWLYVYVRDDHAPHWKELGESSNSVGQPPPGHDSSTEVIDDCTLGRVRILLDMRDQSATT